nr:FRG domain-containing protein [uncultured Pseudomonas sp.]
MADQPSFVTKTYSHALQLLEELSPLAQGWEEGRFVYRGQPDADLGLVPTAHRNRPEQEPMEQIVHEQAVIKAFLKCCDTSGLLVPGDALEARLHLKNFHGHVQEGKRWPTKALHSVMAVAQHNGIPTCLLDWTYRAYVAAYFAASSALHSKDEPRHIALWQLEVTDSKTWQGLSLVELPGGTSTNMAAQAGVFTVREVSAVGDDKWTRDYIDGFAGALGRRLNLRKMILPFREAPRLLAACKSLGVSGSTLFPGYEGVAREMKDWEKTRHLDTGLYSRIS